MSISTIPVLGLTFSWAEVPAWLPLAISGAAVFLALVCLVIVARAAVRLRMESRSASAMVEQLTKYVDSFEQGVSAKMQKAITPVVDRISQGEREASGLKAEIGSLENGIAEVQKGLERAVQRFEHFEEYFRSVFEKELRFAFRAFDETMGGVLKEMKGELLRGIARIDQIQNVVTSRTRAEGQLVSSEEEARRLLKSSAEPAPAPKSEPGGDRSAEEALEPDQTPPKSSEASPEAKS